MRHCYNQPTSVRNGVVRYVVQIVLVEQPERVWFRDHHPPPRPQESRPAYRDGLSEDRGLLGLWYGRGIHYSRGRAASIGGRWRVVYGCIIGRSVGGASGNSGVTNCLPLAYCLYGSQEFARSLRLNNVTHRAGAESFFDYIGG